MISTNRFDLHTLPARLILGFITVMVATLLAIGIPTLWLIRGELERQAQARVEQGANSTRAIYDARVREVQALTNLTADRPTLRALIAHQDQAALSAYLETIRAAAQLDFIIVLNNDGRVLAAAQLPKSWDDSSVASVIQTSNSTPTLLHARDSTTDALVLQATAVVHGDAGTAIGKVVDGIALDEIFLAALQAQTGLRHNFFSDGQRVTVTVPAIPARLGDVPSGLVSLSGESFFAQTLILNVAPAPPQFADVLLLPADEVLATETRVLQVLVASTLVVAILATVLGYLLARRVTAPLQALAAASESIGRGDLTTPIVAPASVTEVTKLAGTFERMRYRLRVAYDELERSKAWSENLIASLAEGVLTVDAAGLITSFSPGAERILGWRATDVIGRSYQSVFQTPLPENLNPASVFRERVSTREGRQIIILTTSGAVTPRDGSPAERALVFRDVTEEEEALRLREFFLANVSHELKTPLSSLRASVELLDTELPALTPDEQHELVTSLWLGVIRLEELVDNLLSSASIRSGHFEVQARATDLETVLEELLLTTRPLLTLRGQHLVLDVSSPLPLVWADARRLNQVLVNLISNATKYGPSNAPITIRARQRHHNVTVEVLDQGVRIPLEVEASLFEPFKRSGDTAYGGVGLGLAIVKTIIERHGGEVGVKPAAGGNSFWFTLLIYKEKTSAAKDKERT